MVSNSITVISKVSRTWIYSSILKIFAYQTSFREVILTKAFCHYILNLMSKKKLGSFNYWIIELLNFFILSYVCHDMNIFWPVSFVKFPRRYWTEFNQSWKTLLSHEIFQSLIDLNGANVGFRSNSRDWVFRIFMMSKINPLMSKNLLFLQLLVNHMIKELYLQNWVPRLEVLHSFLSKGSTWYVHLKFFARCVNSILYLHKNSRNVIP